MSAWLLPLGVELALTVLFLGVVLSMRRSFRLRGLLFWIAVWLARGAGTFLFLARRSHEERSLAYMYAPVQVAFALALVAIAVRLESHKSEVEELTGELKRLRDEAADRFDTDPLTGLRNRSALDRWVAAEQNFDGVVVVCDIDDFKQLNDEFGHIVGDEILHGVGKLVRTSIRENDLAFRWGGDEFVIFFRSHDYAAVEARMRSLEERLQAFHIRKHGPMAVAFSWGISPASGHGVRDSLAEADRRMYEHKRARHEPRMNTDQHG